MESEVSKGTSHATEHYSAETSSQQIERYVCHFLFSSKSRDHVLAEVRPSGIARLPQKELSADFEFAEFQFGYALESLIEEEFGSSVYYVRELWNGINKEIEDVDGVELSYLYLGDVVDDEAGIRKPFEWIHRNVASKLEWVGTNGDGDKHHINRQLQLVFGGINGEEPTYYTEPWKNVGWFTRTRLWIREVLETRNMMMKGRIRQWYRCGQSAVMKCEVRIRSEMKAEGTGGSYEDIFIKCTLPFVREVERTVAIAGVIGNIVPEIIGFKEREGIIMMRNGGTLTDENFDQEALIDTILKFQRLSMNHISELEAGGLKVRDSEWLEANVDSILKHELLDEYCGDGSDLDLLEKRVQMVEKLRSEAGLIRKLCRNITKLGLPRTLVHGDLDDANVGSPAGCEEKVYHIFDWANSFIGNPLYDFEYLFTMTETSLELGAGYEQVYEGWKADTTLTLQGMDSTSDDLRVILNFITFHELTEQYDRLTCSGSSGNWKEIILRGLDEWIEGAVVSLSRHWRR